MLVSRLSMCLPRQKTALRQQNRPIVHMLIRHLVQAAAAAAAKQQAAQAAAPNPEVLAEIKKQMEAAEAARKAAEETKRELDAHTAARKKAPTLQVGAGQRHGLRSQEASGTYSSAQPFVEAVQQPCCACQYYKLFPSSTRPPSARSTDFTVSAGREDGIQCGWLSH